MTDAGGFFILEQDDPLWKVLFNALPPSAQDVFYCPGFARLCQTILSPSEKAICAGLSTEDDSVLLYPFVMRTVAGLVDVAIQEGLQDTISLYGRGGVVGRASPGALKSFHQSLAQYM